jgi:hypothetical protein
LVIISPFSFAISNEGLPANVETANPKKIYDHTDNHNDSVSDLATFSPYLKSNNPAMNPYVPTYNSFTHVIPLNSNKGKKA